LEIIQRLQTELSTHSLDLTSVPQFTECDVGIESFIGKDHTAVQANLKCKYEDFVVTEIDESGNAANITTVDCVDCTQCEQKTDDMSAVVQKVTDELTALVGADCASTFVAWYTQGIKTKHNVTVTFDAEDTSNNNDDGDDKKQQQSDDAKTTVRGASVEAYTFVANKDKSERTRVHQLLKSLPYIQSKTNAASCIEAEIASQKFIKQRWPKSRGAYLKFILSKRGIDSIECLNKLNRKLRLNSNKTFNLAGTKDKHAITSQFVTAYHIDCHALKRAVQSMSHYVRVGNFEYVSQQITLGALHGNRFEIALRNIDVSSANGNGNGDDDDDAEQKKQTAAEIENMLQERVQILQNKGFVNYFGMQRFGNAKVGIGTHHVGRAIVQQQLGLACALLILPKRGESELIAAAKTQCMQTGNVGQYPGMLSSEKRCLSALVDNDGQNFLQALMRIPRNMRSMYCHSYQSSIWNRCVSHRVSTYGFEVVVGDVVYDAQTNANGDGDDDASSRYIYVTDDNIGRFCIEDVVLPLPSFAAKLPKHDSAAFMLKLLENDNVSLQSFAGLQQDFAIKGHNYRRIIARPKDVTARVRYYGNDDELLLDDTHFQSDTTASNVTSNVVEESKTSKIAWILSFALPKSCYATMCLRQLLFTPSDQLKRSNC